MARRELVLGFLLVTMGCTSMRRVQPEFIPTHKPTLVEVWSKTDDVTVVSYPKIDGDTLRGVVLEEPWGIPLKNVAKVEARAPDRTRTVLFVAGATASALGVYLMASSGHGFGLQPCQPDLTAMPCSR